jgi:hypothetical protein
MTERQLAARGRLKKNRMTKLMKTPIKMAMIGALGVLTSVVTFAQTSSRDDSSTQDPPGGQPGLRGPRAEMHRKVLLEKYDANKDGKLDDTEMAALGKDVFEGNLPPPGRGSGPGPGFGRQKRGGPGGPDFGPPGQGGPRVGGERAFCPCGPRAGDGPQARRGRMMDPDGLGRDGRPDRPAFGFGPRGFGRPDSEERQKALAEHRRELIKHYDANGDGKLDSTEREAIGKDIEDGKLPPPPLPSARWNAPSKEAE